MFFSLVLSIVGLFNSAADNRKAIVEDYPFRLCYYVTAALLFFFTSLLGVKDAFRENIVCHGEGDEQKQNAIQQYCWVTGTHMKRYVASGSGSVWENTPEAVREFFQSRGCVYNDTTSDWILEGNPDQPCEGSIIHSWYQWVPYVLLFQGFLFFLPHLIWSQFEGGKMNTISKEVRIGTSQSENYDKKVENVAKSVSQYINMKGAGHRNYGLGYVFSQAMNFVVVIFCIYFSNAFLDGTFNDLGYKWMEAYLRTDEVNGGKAREFLEMIFPRMAGCNFPSYGMSGEINLSNTMCVLAPNALTEKIFVILWFWYGLLALITGLNLLLIISMVFPSAFIRKWYLARAVHSKKVRGVSLDNKLDEKLAKMKFGQFLFLYFLGRNVDYVTFKKVLEALAVQKTGDIYPSVPLASEMATLPKKRRPSDHRQDPHNPLYNVETGAQISK